MTTYVWRSGHLNGGGGVNTVACDPAGTRWVCGGDNNGPKWSVDGGVTWAQGFGGLEDSNIGDELQTIGMIWSQDPAYPDRVWRLSGAGLSVSDNAGKDWTIAHATNTFAQGDGRPRVVGHTLADDGLGRIYCVENQGGVYRYNVDTDAWTQIASLGATATGCSLDPNDLTILYVATRAGVYQIEDIRTTGTVRQFTGTGAPTQAEELVAIDEGTTTAVYVAAYNQGIRKVVSNGDGGAMSQAWTNITDAGMTAASQWSAIDGYRSGGVTYLVAGCANAVKVGTNPTYHEAVWYSDDGGTSWTCLSLDNADMDFVNKMGGAGGAPWWGYGLRTGADEREKSPNRWIEVRAAASGGPTVEAIAFDSVDRDVIIGGGTQGCWMFNLATKKCYPSMMGLHSGVETQIVIDPADDDMIFVANSDHIGHLTEVGGRDGDWRKNEKGTPGGTTALKAVAFDTGATPTALFGGFSDRTANTLGEVYWAQPPWGATDWTALGFRAFGNGKQPIGLGVRRVGSDVIVIAAVRMGGIARAVFSTAEPPAITTGWAYKNQTAFSTFDAVRRAAPIIWASDTLVYAYDPAGTTAGGLWRSTDAGLTWDKIWAAGNRSDDRAGYIAVPPDAPGTVYVSLGPSAGSGLAGVWKLTGAATGAAVGNGITRTEIKRPNGTSLITPSVIGAASGGRVAVVDMGTTESAVYYSGDGGVTVENITDDFFRRSAKKVFSGAMDSEGRFYVTMNGPGVIVGEPDTVTPPPPPPTEPGDITFTQPAIGAAGATVFTQTSPNASSYTTESFTAGGADRLLVAVVINASVDTTAPTPTLTGHSLTWTQRGSDVFDQADTTQRRITWFTAVTTTGSSGALTADFGGESQEGCVIWVGEYADIDPDAPFVQGATANWGGVGSKPSVALTNALATHGKDAVLYASVTARNPAAWTEEVGWTEVVDTGATGNIGLHVAHDLASTDNSFLASAGTNARWAALIMEIAARPGSSASGYTLTHQTDGVIGIQQDVAHDTDGLITAAAYRVVTADADDGDATSYATASITPATGEGVLVAVTNSKGSTPETPTLSGAGLTWTAQRSIEYATDGGQFRRLTVFSGTGTPSTGALTISFGGATQTGCGWIVVGVPGATTYHQAVDDFGITTSLAVPITPVSAAPTVVAFAAKKGSAAITVDDPAIMVSTDDAVNTAPNNRLAAAIVPIDAAYTITASSAELVATGMILVEVSAVVVAEVEHSTDGVISGSSTSPGTGGGKKPPRKPRLPGVSWTIDGAPVSVATDWSATAAAMRGFDQMRGSLTEDEWRRLGSGVGQGSRITGYTDGGDIVWQGRLSTTPEIVAGRADLSAQGNYVRADRRGDRLFIQSADMTLWQPLDGEPFVNDSGTSYYSDYRKINVDVGSRIRFQIPREESLVAGNANGAGFWAEGVALKRVRFTMNYNSNDDSGDFEVRLQRATGPDGTATNVNVWTTSAGNRNTQKSQTVDVPQDLLIITLHANTSHTTTEARTFRIAKVVVNSDIDTGDTFHAHQVASHIGGVLGYDTSGVVASTYNVLPFDWRDGSWAEALTYLAEIEDNVWGVWDADGAGSRLTYDAWGSRSWDVYIGDGARPDLTPMEVFNRARVWYENTHGRVRSVVVDADPDPLAATGLTNTIEYDLRDRQDGAGLATAVASRMAARYARRRYTGRAVVVHAYDATGRDHPYGIRPGDVVRIADWADDDAVTLRVYDVTYRATGVELGLEMPVGLSSLIASVRARRDRRR